MEKYLSFITEKRNQAKSEFEKDFYELLNNAFYGKTMENVRIRLRLVFFKKGGTKNIIKQQSKLIFNGVQEPCKNCDSYTFKQNEVLMDEPISFGFAVFGLSKVLMDETYFKKLQPYFGKKRFSITIY